MLPGDQEQDQAVTTTSFVIIITQPDCQGGSVNILQHNGPGHLLNSSPLTDDTTPESLVSHCHSVTDLVH